MFGKGRKLGKLKERGVRLSDVVSRKKKSKGSWIMKFVCSPSMSLHYNTGIDVSLLCVGFGV
jgi:hypothetical protein